MTARLSGARGLVAALSLLCGAAAWAETGFETRDIDTVRRAAEQGVAAAESELGLRYQNGDGVLQNFLLAADWYARAAQQGDADAQNRLGKFYFEGLGVERDHTVALRWLEAAAEGGDPRYLYDLARALENGEMPDLARAAEIYGRAAELGDADAAVSLGALYQEGRGVEKDLARARELYEGPAAAGHARAQNNLGLLYARGDGVEQDYERAADLFEAAAERGLSQAKANLGVMYENALGVPLDEELAASLYREGGRGVEEGQQQGPVYDARLTAPDTSAEGLRRLRQGVASGDPVAEFQFAWIWLSAESPTAEELSQAVAALKRAASKGLAPAMANLGILYFQGRGVPEDYALGHMWLALAGTSGMAAANDINARLSAKMPASQINEAQEMALERSARR
ncbi:tetratricopeptide repeat protein [Salipiger abyssi]|uniref:Sel1 repeat family protein n=1 Tax=Salipiger abyssi TaxID=1250539 RepID=A0A1P8UXD9_9RHOB|nr:tetratricopeptide repeat protein [Salipiger abyssi]APZ54047.1 hypothetical protein Ga0080574_TMP3713 [Salipiger abyssi]